MDINATTTYNRITSRLGRVRVYAHVNEDDAIAIAAKVAPHNFVTDTGADWSDDYDCWVVPVYLP